MTAWPRLGATALSGIATIAVAARSLRDVRLWEIAIAAIAVAGANGVEWYVHRHVMHRPRRLAASLYRRHAGLHHRWHPRTAMAIRSSGELEVVLLAPWLVPAAILAIAPAMLVLTAAGLPKLASLLAVVVAGYILLYEAAHLLCHVALPPRIASTWPLRPLRRHHALHHDPRRMRTCNFNVLFPLWDALLGTRVAEDREAP